MVPMFFNHFRMSRYTLTSTGWILINHSHTVFVCSVISNSVIFKYVLSILYGVLFLERKKCYYELFPLTQEGTNVKKIVIELLYQNMFVLT